MKKRQLISMALAVGTVFPVVAQNSVVVFAEYSAVDEVNSSQVVVEVPTAVVGGMVAQVEKTDDVLVVPTKPALSKVQVPVENSPSAPSVVEDGEYRYYAETGAVEFDLKKGLLKPQVTNLLMHHRLIDSLDDIQWQASDNFMWPNSHTLKGKSLDYVINAVLAPYELVAEFKGNGSVIVRKML